MARIEDIRKAYPELTAQMDDAQLVRFLVERGYKGRIFSSHFDESPSPTIEEIFAKLQEDQAELEKKSTNPRKAKNKIPNMPTRKADALRWVLIWEKIKPKIENEPSLELNLNELSKWLTQFTSEDIGTVKDDTLRKIIKRGKAGKIPSPADFERKKHM